MSHVALGEKSLPTPVSVYTMQEGHLPYEDKKKAHLNSDDHGHSLSTIFFSYYKRILLI